MKTFVTVEDVDTILGVDWAVADKKARAVLIANVWMTNRNLPDIEPMPEEWKQAAAEIAREAAAGRIYGSRETGVASKSVKAGDVSSSKAYREGSQSYTAGESLALALLAQWLQASGGGMSQFRVLRG